MLGIMLMIGVVVVTIGLGWASFALGKAGKPQKVGLVIPIGYFAVRMLMVLVQRPHLGTLLLDLLPGAVIAGIYYALYVNGRHRT